MKRALARASGEDVPEVAGYHSADVTVLDKTAAKLTAIAEERDGLDVLVNNAGVMQYENAEDATEVAACP